MKFLLLFLTFNAWAVFTPVTTSPPSSFNLPINSKGSIITSNGVFNGELLVGNDGEFLIADSTNPNGSGLGWAAPSVLDTNAGTECAANQYLDGDGTCKSIFTGPLRVEGANVLNTGNNVTTQVISTTHTYSGSRGVNIKLEYGLAMNVNSVASIEIRHTLASTDAAQYVGMTSVPRIGGTLKGGVRKTSWNVFRETGENGTMTFHTPCENIGPYYIPHADVPAGSQAYDIVIGTENSATHVEVNNCRVVIEQL